MILTVAQFRAHMADEVALDDDVLRVMLDRNERAIRVRMHGTAGMTKTEEVWTNGAQEFLPLSMPAQNVLGVDVYDSSTTATTLDASEYQVVPGENLWLRLTGENGRTCWPARCVVQYETDDMSADRIVVLVDLMKCDLNYEPGFSAQSAGPWQESYRKDHVEEREAILDMLVPRPLFA